LSAAFDTWLAAQQHKDLLRFITCGSVDDGKSTLIGRLLFEAQMIYDDQLTALAADSKRIGTRGEIEIDRGEVGKAQGPFPYQPKFSSDNLVANFVVDPIRGFSTRIETQMNDMLENYRFNLGLQFSLSDFKSGDAFGEFQYLPHRMDFSARVDRKVIFWQTKSNEYQGGGNVVEKRTPYPRSHCRWHEQPLACVRALAVPSIMLCWMKVPLGSRAML